MGVVGTVVDTPCCSVGGMAHVASGVRPPCVGSLTPKTRFGRGVDCARGQGSIGAGIAPEAKGSGVAFILVAVFCPLNLGIPVYGTQQM